MHIRLPEEIESRLAALASRTGRSKTLYAREAILTYLEDLKDYYLAAQVVIDICKGAAKTYSNEDVKAALDLED